MGEIVIGRLYIKVKFAKSLLWSKADDTYFFHVGYFERGKQRAYKIIILPLSIMFGWRVKE